MSPAITKVSNLSKLEDLKKVIKCLLISLGNQDVTLTTLNKVYKEEEDEDIPYKDYNYTSLKDFLKSMSDILYLSNNSNNQLCVYHIDSEKSKHISYLVSKAKNNNSSKKNKIKFRLCQSYNTVNPNLLYKIFKKLLNSSIHSKNVNRISKSEVLNEILNNMGKHTFFYMNNLNSQLNEFTHLLIHDDDYIYFKNKLLRNKYGNDVTDVVMNKKSFHYYLQKNKQEKENIKYFHDNSPPILTSISDLIRDSTKNRLQKLMEKYSDGILCSELPKIYRKECQMDLEYSNIGFSSIIEFITALPKILQIVELPNTKKQMVIDARISADDFYNSQISILKSMNKLPAKATDDIEMIPKTVSPNVSRYLVPESVMNIDESIEQIKVTSFQDEKYLDVVVSDAQGPSCFWVILRKNKKKIKILMDDLQEFYTQHNLDEYLVPQIILQSGLHIACVFDGMWHRGVIKKLKGKKVIVFFYDYGTIGIYKPNEIYFLNKKFSELPCQAILCSLNKLRPIGSDEWSHEIRKFFVGKILNKSFIAPIHNINKENNSIIVNLINRDTTSSEDINEWMIKYKFAEKGDLPCQKVYINHFHQSTEKKSKCNIQDCQKPISTENQICNKTNETEMIITRNHISCIQKLEAIKKYREKFSSDEEKTSDDTNYPDSTTSSNNFDTTIASSISSSDIQISTDSNYENTFYNSSSSSCTISSTSSHRSLDSDDDDVDEDDDDDDITVDNTDSKDSDDDQDDDNDVGKENFSKVMLKNDNKIPLQFVASNMSDRSNCLDKNKIAKSQNNYEIPLKEWQKLICSTQNVH